MFKSESPLFNLIANFVIGSLLFLFFQSIGWITITSALPFLVIMLIIGLVNVFSSLITTFITLIALPLILIISILTLGIGAILIPCLITYGTLYLTSYFTGLFVMNVGVWGAIGIGAAFGLLRFSTPSRD